MRRAVVGACLAACLASTAAASSLFDYGWGMADARIPMNDAAFNIWIAPHRPTFLIEPAMKTVMGGGGHFPDPVWRTVAEAFVQPIGCGISEVRPLSRMGAAWEATYVCPGDVDLIHLVREQRDALKRGERLHLHTEPQLAVPPTVPSAPDIPPPGAVRRLGQTLYL